ncbi:MAG: NAD(P)/FAD-dependent oxidoreductase, partial [Pseudomonadota bacterium]
QDDQPGGLAGSFDVNGTQLEKFYHHWFKSDEHIHDLVAELGREDEIVYRQTKTGSYYANSLFRLSSPLDLLSYTPLSLIGRIRLGLLVFQAQAVKDWRKIEDMKAVDWLISKCGKEVYETVWKPLLAGKFGKYSEEIGAVWMWNKLALRGGSRDKGGKEILAYYKGGFAALSRALADQIEEAGGEIHLSTTITKIETEDGALKAIHTDKGVFNAQNALSTLPQPVFAEMLQGQADSDYVERLREIDYLGNVCMVLEMNKSLSSTYWINVVDPGFPFVGVIEHTNFEPPEHYGGKHIVYLSKYLPVDTDMYQYNSEQMLDFAMPHLQKMFPELQRDWIAKAHVFRSNYTQPIVRPGYSKLIPDHKTPVDGLWLASMAQIYPEDRGTNYAVREGRKIGHTIGETLSA